MKITKVVTYDQVEHLTRDGWALVFTIQHAQRIAAERVVKVPAHQGPNYQWINDEYEVVNGIITEPLFVLEKEADVASREAELHGELDAYRTRVYELERQLEEAKTAGATAIKRVEEMLAEVRTCNDRLGATRINLENERTANRKLEEDIGKIRKEIGDARMREVIGR